MKELAARDGVLTVVAHQNMLGLLTNDQETGKLIPARKATKFMTNSRAIAGELSRRCDKSHAHQQLISGRAQAAQQYPPELCSQILLGVGGRQKLEAQALWLTCGVRVTSHHTKIAYG